MKDTAKEDLIISTKFTPQCEDKTPDAMQHMIDGSKERLGIDVIDILLSVMKESADDHGATVAQIATSWAISKGTIPIIGVTKVSQVEDAVKTVGIKLSEYEVRRMEETADQVGLSTIRYWEKKIE